MRGKASGLKWSVVTAVLVLLACVGPRALAQEPTEASVRAISAVQDALVWTGHYNGLTDGVLGPRSLEAIHTFQRLNGWPTGELKREQIAHLFGRASELRQKFQFDLVFDERALVTIGIPKLLVTKRTDTRRGSRYTSADNELVIIVGRFTREEGSLQDLFNRVVQSSRIETFSQRVFKPEAFYVSGEDDTKEHYYTGKISASGVVGLSISYPKIEKEVMDRLVVAIVNAFHNPIATYPDLRVHPEPRVAGHSATHPELPDASRLEPRLSTGSGFFVDQAGHVMTSNHVVSGCGSIEVKGHGRARIVRNDPANDLAILKVEPAVPTDPVRFRSEELELGEKILVLGYPLQGVLAASLNVTTGIISSVQGLAGDNRYVQISAPVQHGNSGGPLLDYSGRVAGVVTAKLNHLYSLVTRGAVPENVAFALRSSYALALLAAARIPVIVEHESATLTEREIAKASDNFTVLVVCSNRTSPAEAYRR